MNYRNTKILTVVLIGLASSLFGQKATSPRDARDKETETFAKIPSAHRERFLAGLNLVVEYQTRGNWTKLYDLLLPSVRPDTREEYVREKKKGYELRLAKFTPDFVSTEQFVKGQHVDSSQYGEWTIMGCGEYGWGWGKEKYRSAITARLDHGEWLFTEVGILLEAIDGPPARCNKKQKK